MSTLSSIFIMAGYFAELKNNIVQRVVSSTTKEWCETALGGEWVQTYYFTEGKNYAGIGHTYDPSTDNFIAIKPFPSWVLNSSQKWVAPVPYPNDGKMYLWNEDITNWDRSNLL